MSSAPRSVSVTSTSVDSRMSSTTETAASHRPRSTSTRDLADDEHHLLAPPPHQPARGRCLAPCSMSMLAPDSDDCSIRGEVVVRAQRREVMVGRRAHGRGHTVSRARPSSRRPRPPRIRPLVLIGLQNTSEYAAPLGNCQCEFDALASRRPAVRSARNSLRATSAATTRNGLLVLRCGRFRRARARRTRAPCDQRPDLASTRECRCPRGSPMYGPPRRSAPLPCAAQPPPRDASAPVGRVQLLPRHLAGARVQRRAVAGSASLSARS